MSPEVDDRFRTRVIELGDAMTAEIRLMVTSASVGTVVCKSRSGTKFKGYATEDEKDTLPVKLLPPGAHSLVQVQ